MTQVKICGLSTVEAISCAIQSGADYLGFIFAKSSRNVTIEQVQQLLEQVAIPETVKIVGVFVSPTRQELLDTQRLAGLDLVQVHGTLPDITDLPFPVIQAQSVTQDRHDYHTTADYLLLDAPATIYQGGNGTVFDWTSVDPHTLPDIWLAGGLNSTNVTDAVAYFQPLVVDVSSGVETNGQKDCQKIQLFCHTVKENHYV